MNLIISPENGAITLTLPGFAVFLRKKDENHINNKIIRVNHHIVLY